MGVETSSQRKRKENMIFHLSTMLLCFLSLLLGDSILTSNPSPLGKISFKYGTIECGDRCSTPMVVSLTVYGEWQNAVFTFLSLYVESNSSMVFDVFAGIGMNHVSLGNITPTQIFSIETDAESYHLLLRNSQLNGVISRALVAQLDPSLPFVTVAELRSGRGMYRNVFDLYRMTSQCPTVVKLSEVFNESTLEVTMTKAISTLVQSLWLLKYCQPLFYVASSTSSYPLIRILSSLPYYRVFWHVTTAIRMSIPHRKQDNQVVISLVAIPLSMHDPKDVLCDDEVCDAMLIPVEERKYFIQDYDLQLRYHKNSRLSNSIDDDDDDTSTHGNGSVQVLVTGKIAQDRLASEQTCDQSDNNSTTFVIPILHHQSIADVQLSTACHEANVVSFSVHLEAIMSPFHPLMDVVDGSVSESSLSKQSIVFHECLVSSVELYIESIIEAKCIVWLSSLRLDFHQSANVKIPEHSHYADRYTESERSHDQSVQHDSNDDNNDNTLHIHALVKACTAFATKQWHMMNDMAIYRAASPVPILPRLSDLVNNNNNDSNSNNNRNGSNNNSSNSNNTTKSTIENDNELLNNNSTHRSPFSLLWSPAACGEPLWCTHTIELQRRLTAWQNPNRNDHIVSGTGSMNIKTSQHNDSQQSDSPKDTSSSSSQSSRLSKEKRTCKNAKYLLFQPRSDQNGIGNLTATYPTLAHSLTHPLSHSPTLSLSPSLNFLPHVTSGSFSPHFLSLTPFSLSPLVSLSPCFRLYVRFDRFSVPFVTLSREDLRIATHGRRNHPHQVASSRCVWVYLLFTYPS